MTDEIVMLQSRIDAMQIRAAAVEADNARLRGLLKRGEWQGEGGHWEEAACPWCSEGKRAVAQHANTCAAFTTSGDVR